MKSTATLFSKLLLTIAAVVMCIDAGHGQSGNPYDTGSDNPFFKKALASPSPSASMSPAKGAKAAAAKATISDKDNRFLSDAGSSFGWEVKTGSAAESKAQDAKTKQIATRLVASYSKLAKELTDLAAKKGHAISIEGVKAQQINGANYDKSYLSLVQQDHQQMASAFRKASQSADPDIKAWAARTLSTIQQNAAAAK